MNNTGVKVLQAGHIGVECDDSVAEKMLLLLTRSTAPVCTICLHGVCLWWLSIYMMMWFHFTFHFEIKKKRMHQKKNALTCCVYASCLWHFLHILTLNIKTGMMLLWLPAGCFWVYFCREPCVSGGLNRRDSKSLKWSTAAAARDKLSYLLTWMLNEKQECYAAGVASLSKYLILNVLQSFSTSIKESSGDSCTWDLKVQVKIFP